MRAQTQVVGAVPPGWRGAREREREKESTVRRLEEK